MIVLISALIVCWTKSWLSLPKTASAEKSVRTKQIPKYFEPIQFARDSQRVNSFVFIEKLP